MKATGRGSGTPLRRVALGLLGLGVAASLACGAEPEAAANESSAAVHGGSAEAGAPQGLPPAPPGVKRDVASIRVRDLGEIRIELLPELAPKTVENFIKLAEAGFYEGTTFHRVIPDFAIQGGDPNTKDRDPRNDGRGGPGYSVPDEFGPVPQIRGLVSMANMSRPDSGGSQFFVLVGNAPPLTGKYSAFGFVVAGMDVADRIAGVERDEFGRHGPRDRPRSDIVIESIRIERAGEVASRP